MEINKEVFRTQNQQQQRGKEFINNFNQFSYAAIDKNQYKEYSSDSCNLLVKDIFAD